LLRRYGRRKRRRVVVVSAAASTFTVLTCVVTPTYRRNVLAVVQPLANVEAHRHELPGVAVRWYSLFAPQQRKPAEALHNSVLGQLKRQLSPSQLLALVDDDDEDTRPSLPLRAYERVCTRSCAIASSTYRASSSNCHVRP